MSCINLSSVVRSAVTATTATTEAVVRLSAEEEEVKAKTRDGTSSVPSRSPSEIVFVSETTTFFEMLPVVVGRDLGLGLWLDGGIWSEDEEEGENEIVAATASEIGEMDIFFDFSRVGVRACRFAEIFGGRLSRECYIRYKENHCSFSGTPAEVTTGRLSRGFCCHRGRVLSGILSLLLSRVLLASWPCLIHTY